MHINIMHCIYQFSYTAKNVPNQFIIGLPRIYAHLLKIIMYPKYYIG